MKRQRLNANFKAAPTLSAPAVAETTTASCALKPSQRSSVVWQVGSIFISSYFIVT
jgi:hypothetical protein